MRTIAICAFALTLIPFAKAAEVDWKLYGGASVAGSSFCFYDAKSVARTSNVRVWTKCLLEKDLEVVDPKDDLGHRIVDSAARKIIQGYVPPIVSIGKMDFAQVPEIAVFEEAANIGNIEPQATIFNELNCPERMMRRLSTSININGKSGFQNKPSDWEYVPPEGNVATLLRLLCQKQ